MIVPHYSAFYCAACREPMTFNEAEHAWVILHLGPTSRGWLVYTVHHDEGCGWRFYLNNPHVLDEPLDPRVTLTVALFEEAGFAVEGLGDDRGFARLTSSHREVS